MRFFPFISILTCLPHLWFSQQTATVCEGSVELLWLSISVSCGQQEMETSQQRK